MGIENYMVQGSDNTLKAKTKLAIRIPKANFEGGLSEEVDSTIVTYGFFTIEVLDAKGNVSERFSCSFPNMITLNVFEREDTSDDIVLYYDKDATIISQTTYIPGIQAVTTFMNILIRGGIKVSSPDELINAFISNMLMNGVKPKVPYAILEIMIGEMFRWKEDDTIPLRVAMKDPKVKFEDGFVVNIKEIARLSSVFGAVAFEDINKSVESSIAMTRGKVEQTYSPLESVLHL